MTSMNGGGVPAAWPGRIRALRAGELVPPVPRRAATVLLLREGGQGAGGPAVHMLRRHAGMAFAAGAYAYPGGGVDPRDERPVGWAGPDLAAWSAALGVPPAHAQAVVCAAVRETFEESGVLLAGPDATTVVADTTGEDWEADRAALVGHEVAFADFLARRALVLRSDLLAPWARWITPEFEERRYDTWFFLALLPVGQRTRDVSGEADRTVWLRPAEAVAGYDRGEMVMLPPTISTLRALLPYGTAAEALAAAPGRDLSPVLARAALREDGAVVLSWPGHEEFTQVLPAGLDASPPDASPLDASPLDASPLDASPLDASPPDVPPSAGAPSAVPPSDASAPAVSRPDPSRSDVSAPTVSTPEVAPSAVASPDAAAPDAPPPAGPPSEGARPASSWPAGSRSVPSRSAPSGADGSGPAAPSGEAR